MLDNLLENIKRFFQSRLLPVTLVYICLAAVLIHRIFYLQIVKGEEYAESGANLTTKYRYITSTRGNIYDREGNLLAYNGLSYAVTLESVSYESNDEYNAMIYRLVSIIEQNGGELATTFYIEQDKNGNLVFNAEESTILRFKRDIYYAKSVDTLTEEQVDADAEEVYEFLRSSTAIECPKFLISDEYSTEDTLKIMSVRYALFMQRYSQYNPITIAHNVDEETVAALKENQAELPGMDIEQESYRIYNASEAFSHILGYTGRVSDETLEELKENDQEGLYTEKDQTGKSGLESSYEEYLHGKNGSEKLTVDATTGKVQEVVERTDPVAGDDLTLTLSGTLQNKIYSILEKNLTRILISNIVNSKNTGTKGKSAKDIKIPIYDVYYSFIDNNLIDVTHFNDKNATDTEQSVYAKYLNKRSKVFEKLDTLLATDSKVVNTKASDEYEEYLTYIYSMLKTNGIVLSDEIPEDNATYKNYANNKISLSEYLQYLISNNWIDLKTLAVDDDFSSTSEIYAKLRKYIKSQLKEDKEFTKKLYYYMIDDYTISGKDICILLYDQGFLKYDEGMVAKLSSGAVSAYSFIIQKMKAYEITPGDLGLDPCSGSVIVTKVNTGEALAAVSYPGYDNNKLANSVDSEYYERLMDSNSLYMNFRPTQTKFAPGSTYKPLIAVAALEEGVITTTTENYCGGIFKKISPSPKCHIYPSGHGSDNVSEAIRDSCNVFFYEVGYRLSSDNGKYNSAKGLKTIRKYAKMFGLNAHSGLEVTEYDSQISNEDAVRSAIGQGTNAYYPAQLARYVTTIANEGTCYDLTLVDKVTDLNGDVVLNNKAKVRNELTSVHDSTWDAVKKGMYMVVNSSYSMSAMFSSVGEKVAGKTGTAQQSVYHPNHALFISFAPYDDPEITVTVAIPYGYTSSNAAQVARDVYKYYFKQYKKDVKKNKQSSKG
jgi:penicillin-binding protein 2